MALFCFRSRSPGRSVLENNILEDFEKIPRSASAARSFRDEKTPPQCLLEIFLKYLEQLFYRTIVKGSFLY